MKKIYLSLAGILFLFQFSYAQWSASGNNISNTNSGNVGIGTSTPSSLLTLNSNSGANLLLQTNGSNIAAFSVNNNSSIWNGAGGISLNLVATTADINFQTGSPATTNMILKNNGFVGIGTINPTARLTLAGGGNLNPNTGAEIDYTGQNLTFRGENAGGSFNLGTIKMVQPTGTYVDHADMVFYTAPGGGTNTEKLRITGLGNVLIGRTTQNNSIYMLDVNGPAHATSIVVNSGGADFVFEPTYHLFPLADLKKYLDQNHHLPEIPSAKEMQTNGLNVGDNQTKLLQKVEELTLYLIEQKNANEAMLKEIHKMRSELFKKES